MLCVLLHPSFNYGEERIWTKKLLAGAYTKRYVQKLLIQRYNSIMERNHDNNNNNQPLSWTISQEVVPVLRSPNSKQEREKGQNSGEEKLILD